MTKSSVALVCRTQNNPSQRSCIPSVWYSFWYHFLTNGSLYLVKCFHGPFMYKMYRGRAALEDIGVKVQSIRENLKHCFVLLPGIAEPG